MFHRSIDDRTGHRGTRTLLALVVSLLIAWSGLASAPAQAAGSAPTATITKAVSNQKAAYDKGDTVIYRLNVQCSSLEEPCKTGTVTDVLDANLDYVSYQVVRNTSDGVTSAAPVTFAKSGQTLTWSVGDATDASKYFMDGESFDIVVNAKVKSVPTTKDVDGKLTIPNVASVSIPAMETPKTSDTVKIVVNPAAPAVHDWTLTKAKGSPSGDPALGQNVTYDIRFSRPSVGYNPAPGGVDLSTFVLTDAIPAGATYVSSSIDSGSGTPVYNSAANTVTFPGTTLSATSMYCGDGKTCISYWVAHITVKYPTGTFKTGDQPVNKATADVTYTDGEKPTLTAQAPVTLIDATMRLSPSKGLSSNVNPTVGDSVGWNVYVHNTGNVPVDDAIVIDTLPAGMGSFTITVPEWYMPTSTGSGAGSQGVFEYTTDGTTWTALGTLGHQASTVLTVPGNATKVRMTAHDVPVDGFAGYRVNGTVKDGVQAGTVINNCMSYAGSISSTADTCNAYTVQPRPEVRVYPSKTHQTSDGGSNVSPGDEFYWILNWRLIALQKTPTATITDLLPSQFELVTEDAPCLGVVGTWDSLPAGCPSTFQDVAAPTVAGSTITFTDLAMPDMPRYNGDYRYAMYVKVRVKDGAAAGTYTNTMTVTPPATTSAVCGSSDPITPDKPCAATDSVTVDTSAAVGLQKWDKGSEPNVTQDTGQASDKCPDLNGYTRYPCVAQTLPGGSFDYLLRWSNQGNVALTNAVVYDILPHVGDTGVGQTLSGQSRSTEWSPVLTGPITLESSLTTATGSNYVVEYNTTDNPCRPELKEGSADGVWQTSCDDTWTTTVSDWSTVKSFRIKAYQGAGDQWAPGTRLVFHLPMKAPDTAAYSTLSPKLDLSVAWNSASQRAYQVNAGGPVRLQATEPRKVGIIIPAPYVSIGDYVWYDANRNGRQDEGEKPAPGVAVALKDASGKTVATTTTDADGYYWFQNLPEKTNYTLVFTRPDGYEWTGQNKGTDGAADSDVNAAGEISVTTPAWKQGVSRNEGGHNKADDPTLDAGLVLPVPLVSVGDYVWWDANRDGLQSPGEKPIANVAVELHDKDGALVSQTTTDANGYYSFTDLVAGESYTIHFVSPAGAVPTTSSVTGGDDALDSDPVNGDVTFTAPENGANKATDGKGTWADNPTIDAGFISYNLTLTKDLAPGQDPVRLGQDVTYTLSPSNDGPAQALAGWSVTDLLPAGLTLKSISGAEGSGYTCTKVSDSEGTCTNDTVFPAGKGQPITVVATVGANASGSLKNVAYVAPATGDVAETNPLVVPGLGTDTTTTGTDNDAQAVVSLKPLVSIGDYVWYDTDRDGVQDASEQPYSGMTVQLLSADGKTVVQTTTTDGSGYYAFKDLEASTAYQVRFVKKTDESFTGQAAGSDKAVDSNPDASGVATVTTPATGSNLTAPGKADDPTIDAGIVKYNLVIDKSLTSTGPFYENGKATFTIVPRNAGPADELAGWSVTDLLPPGLTVDSVTSADPAAYTCNVATPATQFTCTATGRLAAGASGSTITVVTTIGANVVGTLHNVTYVSPSPQSSSVPETNPLTVPTPQTSDGWGTDTSTSGTDNDAQAELKVDSLVSIGDYVWWDTNRNGTQDEGEKPVPGVTVKLYDKDGNQVGAPTITDEDGYYAFDDLTPGAQYTVEFVKPHNTVFTTRNDEAATSATDSDADVTTGRVDVTAPASGENRTGHGQADNPTIDAGLIKLVSVGDYVWYDANRNGQQDPAESPVEGVTVNLISGGTVIATTQTDEDGYYHFTDLLAGAPYTIEFVKPANTVFTASNVGADTSDSDADVTTGRVDFTAPLIGINQFGQGEADEDDPTIDAGLVKLVSIGDYVWYDTNRDGLQTAGEAPVPNVTVNLYDESGTKVDSTTTDAKGYYAFKDLLAETTYTVEFVKPDGSSFTTALSGDPAKDSNADPVTGRYELTTPATGSNLTDPGKADDPTIDAGLVSYNLKITKVRTSAETIRPGEQVTFRLVPSNDGPVNALAGWSVTDLLPAELSLVSMSGDGYQCTGTVCVATAPLAAGGSGAPITVVATVNASFTGSLWNVAYVAPAPGDITETVPLGELPTNLTDTGASATDNDDRAMVKVVPAELLAGTGSNVSGALLVGGLLLLAGGGALILVRRRLAKS